MLADGSDSRGQQKSEIGTMMIGKQDLDGSCSFFSTLMWCKLYRLALSKPYKIYVRGAID